ncbi:hypothetical protein PMAYCL1PPCAC_13812, partial [Pristionchus mayeri]
LQNFRYALAKLESNRAANEAVLKLNGYNLPNGAVLTVRRAEYWSETRWLTPQSVLQQPRPQPGWWTARNLAESEVAPPVTFEDVNMGVYMERSTLDSDNISYFSID